MLMANSGGKSENQNADKRVASEEGTCVVSRKYQELAQKSIMLQCGGEKNPKQKQKQKQQQQKKQTNKLVYILFLSCNSERCRIYRDRLTW